MLSPEFSPICQQNVFWFCSNIHICSECEKAQVSEEAKDKEISEWLWKLSEKWTGLNGSAGLK